ncbi:hypothetical protein G210_3580 [Candida maltosa Xu316]|uniref:Uncharacterized protein n=1 Tax=Candida maltosa (strain Xu316) TaxID=1245528 RepID=M3IIK3_CANMX|nr:hypothetical protein G210_3580 [Candida maltosa Xu316]
MTKHAHNKKINILQTIIEFTINIIEIMSYYTTTSASQTTTTTTVGNNPTYNYYHDDDDIFAMDELTTTSSSSPVTSNTFPSLYPLQLSTVNDESYNYNYNYTKSNYKKWLSISI